MTGAVTVSTDVTIQDDLILDSDAAVLSFGEDNEITLTHVADTGLLLNTASVIQFRDSAINIGSPADGDLDINADDEIELNSTLIDINGNVEISGTLTQTGIATFAAIPVFSAGINVSGGTIAGTVATATQNSITTMTGLVTTGALDTGSITSGFGTIDTGASAITTTGLISGGSLDIDNVLINGTTIGHTDDTDLITLADGIVTVAGEISVTTLDIGGTNVTSTAAELNILDDATVTTAELNLIDGGTSRGTTAVASGDGILINDGGTMRMTNVDTVSTYFASHTVGGGNIVTTGALGSGSIAAGFGAIDNGTSGIRTNTFTAETAFVPDASDGAALGTTSLQFSDLFLADGAVMGFGDDQDVTITHVHDVGLLFSDGQTDKLMFNDASQYIQGASATVLDIAATDEIELTATLIEVVGNATVSGTLGVTGVTTSNAGVVVDNITIDGTEIDLSSGDLLVDVAGDITLDAGGGNVKIAVGGTDILDIANSSNNVIIKPVVDAKDIIFQQRDGTEVARIEDNATFNVVTGKLAINGTAVTSTAAELNLLDGVSGLVQADLTKLAAVDSTAAELNKLDGVGVLKQAGKETMWVPASAMYPSTSNGADPQQVETTSGRPDMKVLDFDKASDEFAQFSVAFPKSWNEGTVSFQFYWTPAGTSTGNCAMALQGVACGDSDTIDIAYGTAITVLDAGIGTIEDQQVSPESGAITIAGSPAVNQLVYFQLFRDANDNNDVFDQDCRLIGIKIFFTTDAANDA